MNRTSNNRSGLFLLEIMIAILFFAMVSAVCLRSFASAHIKPGGFGYEPGYVTYRKRSRTPEIG